jgi:hypothetical protein
MRLCLHLEEKEGMHVFDGEYELQVTKFILGLHAPAFMSQLCIGGIAGDGVPMERARKGYALQHGEA